MKRYYFSFLLLITAFVTQAQITLTSSTNAPVIGDVFAYKLIDTSCAPGASGANVTWDFSAKTIDTNKTITTYIAAAGTPYVGNYPTATLASQSGTSYSYYKVDATGYYELGGQSSATSNNVLSKPLEVVAFPLTYNGTFNNIFQGHSNGGGIPDSAFGVNNGLADAYGTLKTPDGNVYNNALRVKVIESYDDSLIGFVGLHYVWTSYNWYVASQHKPVFYIQSYITWPSNNPGSINKGKSVYMGYTPATGINEIAGTDLHANLYPNPTGDNFTNLQFVLKEEGQTVIKIMNMQGQEVLNLNKGLLASGSYSESIQTQGLSSGLYFVEIKSGISKSVSKLIVE